MKLWEEAASQVSEVFVLIHKKTNNNVLKIKPTMILASVVLSVVDPWDH